MEIFYKYVMDNKEFIIKRTYYYLNNSIDNGDGININICSKAVNYIIDYWIVNKDIKELKKIIKIAIINETDNKAKYFKKSNIAIMLKSIKWSILDLSFKVEKDISKINSYYIIIDNMFDELEVVAYEQWEELSEDHMNFKVLAETMRSSLFIICDNKFKYVNLEAMRLFGYTEEELRTMEYWQVVHPENRGFVKKRIDILKDDGETHVNNYEIKILTKGGEEKWVALNTSMIVLDGIKCIIGVGIDITYKKEMERQLEIFDKKMGNLMETINIGVELLKGNDIKYINNFMPKITGYTKEELLKMNLKDMLHNEFKKDLDDLLNDNLYKDIVNSNFRKEIKLIRKDKKEIWVDLNARVCNIDDEAYKILCFNDITESKEVLKKLQNSKQIYKNILEILPNGVILEKDHKIIYCNKCSASILGYKNYLDLLNKDINEVIELYDINKMDKNAVKNSTEGNILTQGEDTFIRKKDGKKLDLDVKITKGYANDEEVTLIMFNDISHRKKIEQLQKRMEVKNKEIREIKEYDKLKTSFFSNISHELRTPLNVILGAVQLLKLIIRSKNINEDRERIEKYISIIQRNSFRMIKLSNNLIDSAEIECGNINMNLNNYDIVELVKGIKDSVQKYANLKNIDITFNSNEDNTFICCDQSKIERIILNVLSNAVKFTEDEGKIEINIYNNKKYVIVSIKDNGIGIPEDKQNMIFESFSRVDKSFSRNTEGTGMGLAIAKSLVEMHNGKITLESKTGLGSDFKIYLPNKKIMNISDEISNYIEPFGIEKVDIEFSDIYAY